MNGEQPLGLDYFNSKASDQRLQNSTAFSTLYGLSDGTLLTQFKFGAF